MVDGEIGEVDEGENKWAWKERREKYECIYENFKKINKQKIKFDLYFRNISQNLEIRNVKDYETSLFLKNENVIKIST